MSKLCSCVLHTNLSEISDTHYNIHLRLEVEPTKYLALSVIYPETYPESVPELDVFLEDGSFFDENPEDDEDEDEEEPQYDPLAEESAEFEKSDIEHLKKRVEESAEENLGMPSIFAIVSELKDNAEQLYNDKVEEKIKIRKQKEREQEEKDQEKFRGTPVTPESFAAWKEKFEAEQKEGIKLLPKTGPQKLTGKQIFEQGLNKDDDDDEGVDGDEELASNAADLKIE